MTDNKKNVHIVIDASVARASGDTSVHPTSKFCREAMLAVSEKSMVAVFSPELRAEWMRHASNFSRGWLINMVARGLFSYVTPHPINDILRGKIEKFAPNEKAAGAMLKDVHLVELSNNKGKRVAALDEVVRNLFIGMSKSCDDMSTIMWVNPAVEGEAAIDWLKNSAPTSKERLLCV
ncbi:hypothetical protein BZG29_13065 [Janthinobacterium sp. LM6]|uniref:hypothetical protein n=1 Tax=Janthinobacterium sp. LM6 TaxID=1938606 RepID=UPI00098406ED|nr:hypothetical protein [Janthinobacterium sp. LM6]AQR69166.1 hypothetical protein BZG29_13065 [Janthinobacterium sp. LM6]